VHSYDRLIIKMPTSSELQAQAHLVHCRRASGSARRLLGQQSWPKAAYWRRGHMRMASRCCDAPVKTPLTPLHELIRTLGPLPPLQALNTYVMRLREHGWNAWQVVQKAIQCGAAVDSEIARVVRIHVRASVLAP
jgi:hypothetical protein